MRKKISQLKRPVTLDQIAIVEFEPEEYTRLALVEALSFCVRHITKLEQQVVDLPELRRSVDAFQRKLFEQKSAATREFKIERSRRAKLVAMHQQAFEEAVKRHAEVLSMVNIRLEFPDPEHQEGA